MAATMAVREPHFLESSQLLPSKLGRDHWERKIRSVIQHRAASLAKLDPPLPELPRELPSNVTGIPAQLLSTEELEITETPLKKLLEQLANAQLTAVSVAKAFLRRAGLAQKLVNCTTELLTEQALERAAYLDDYLRQNGKPIGALHGLPMSTKEHLNMRGWESNFSFVARIGHIAQTDGDFMRALYDAGAVFHVRTTQPQSLLQMETSSTIYGVTVNPYNSALTSGGSSGGEGAIIAVKGSLLGTGSDTGGSIRGPAGMNGIYGFKPTASRLSFRGLEGLAGGRDQIQSPYGPMATNLDGIDLWMKVVIGSRAWERDTAVPPLEWRDKVDFLIKKPGTRGLKVGVMWDDGIVVPHPPVRRALREVVEKLKKCQDVTVVEWKPYEHQHGFDIWNHLLFADNAELMLELFREAGEPLRPLTKFILEDNPAVAKRSLQELFEWTAKRDAWRAGYGGAWQATAENEGDEMDVILCPVYPGGASQLGHTKYWNYTLAWNVLDYPSIAFPASTATPEQDPHDHNFQAKNELDETHHQLYDAELYRGVPIALQLVGRRWEDEKVLQALRFIEEKLAA